MDSKLVCKSFTLRAVFVILLVSLLFISLPASSLAQTVTNLNDSGPGSLRGVIGGAAPGATIDFSPALNGGTITLLTQIDINKNLIINGPGADNLTISGGDSTRILKIVNPTTSTVISDLRFANGLASTPLGGGAIEFAANNSNLVINRCVFEFNASACVGVDCSGGGGAIVVSASFQDVRISNSTFSFNSASCIGIDCDGNGAALRISGGVIFLEVNNTTFDNNSSACTGIDCDGQGAAVSIPGGEVNASFINSTFANNSSTCQGNDCNGSGAITLTGGDQVLILFSTFDSNTSSCSGGDCLEGGANITNIGGGEIRLGSSIFNTTSPNGNCGGDEPIISLGYNIANDATCFDSSVAGDKPDTNPRLDPDGLQNNGGPTQTIALTSTSPAIDMANPACPPPDTDQRGVSRPEGTRCDIGAYEGSIVISVPTLSQWGLIAIAGILGIIGFIVIRRKQLAA